MGAVAPLGPSAGTCRRRADWPRRGTRGSGTSLGTIRGVWRTRPWPSRRRGSTRGRCTQRGRVTTTLVCSGEQSRKQQGSTQEIRGAGRFLTSRGSDGVTGQRRWRRNATGQRRWSSSCARTTPVSADRTDQRGGGHTEGCPEKLMAR
jgi:hypothetical protein